MQQPFLYKIISHPEPTEAPAAAAAVAQQVEQDHAPAPAHQPAGLGVGGLGAVGLAGVLHPAQVHLVLGVIRVQLGGAAAQALVRAGIGELTFIDGDCIALSNINRQLIAFESTLGRLKAEVMAEIAQNINPDAVLHTFSRFYQDGDFEQLLSGADYIIDAIDMVSAKLSLIQCAVNQGVPIISAMGCGGRLNPGLFKIADIYSTSICPLCRVMRRELKKRSIRK